VEASYKSVSAAISERLKSTTVARRVVLLLLTAGGAAIATIAQFTQVPPSGFLSGWQLAGIFGAAFVFLGATYSIIAEPDASSQLETARVALDEALRIQRQSDDHKYAVLGLQTDIDRATNLYFTLFSMRNALEQVELKSDDPEAEVTRALFRAALDHLPRALGFETRHFWTVGVYRASVGTDGETELVLVEQHRSIQCDIAKARKWKPGTGFAGISFTNSKELILDDANHETVRMMAAGANLNSRQGDDEKYVSFAVSPILVNGDKMPWGVAIATSNQAGHFRIDQVGVQAAECVRALSGMVALGVCLIRRPPTKAKEKDDERTKDIGVS
jgi:hypothetical protein